jgi:hypothetical protein
VFEDAGVFVDEFGLVHATTFFAETESRGCRPSPA